MIRFKMFNLENFDFDFDDDFSSDTFTKKPNTQAKNGPGQKTPNTKAVENNTPKCSGSFFNFLLNESSTNLKRPISEEDRPQKKRFSHEGLVQRKFPGPAGLLPDKPFREISDVSLLIDKPRNEEKEKCVVYSQSSGSVFLESGYQKLVADFNLNEVSNPLNKYTVEWVKKTALNKGLQGKKIPFLGVVIHSVNHNNTDPVVHLRDPTGEINGTLHREVWADLGGKLQSGIALALRQVGVLITGVIRRQIYLNITMNNILAIYSPSENKNQVEITTINRISREELNTSFEQWLTKSKPQPAKPPSDLQLFTTVNDLKQRQGQMNLKNKPDHSTKENSELASLGIVLTDDDFCEEIVPVSSEKSKEGVLSQEESAIFEEVLSGINLDEFEM